MMRVDGDDRERTRAIATNQTSWGKYGSDADHARYAKPIADRRRGHKCPCCGVKATHVGMANGICLMAGCELQVRRWVRDPATTLMRVDGVHEPKEAK